MALNWDGSAAEVIFGPLRGLLWDGSAAEFIYSPTGTEFRWDASAAECIYNVAVIPKELHWDGSAAEFIYNPPGSGGGGGGGGGGQGVQSSKPIAASFVAGSYAQQATP